MKKSLGLGLSVALALTVMAVVQATTVLAKDEGVTESTGKSSVSHASVTGGEFSEIRSKKSRSDSIQRKKPDYVDGEVIVKFRETKTKLTGSSGRTFVSTFAKSKALVEEDVLANLNISVFKIDDGTTVQETINILEADPNVEYAEPNYRLYPATIVSDDTHADRLWSLHNNGQTVGGTYTTNNPGAMDSDMDAPEAWSLTEGTNGQVIVAVIDDGIAYNHPDLLANMWDGTHCKDELGAVLGGCIHGYDFADNDKNPLPSGTHGTHVAGTIAAIKNNGRGIVGVAPHAKIMALKFGFDVASEVRAIDFAIQNGAHVINASYGSGQNSTPEREAIARFRDAGGIFVAAAGNGATSNETSHYYPSDYDLENIISVAATDQRDELASFSNYGATSVDVGAPGVNIYSTVPSESELLRETFEGKTPPLIPDYFIPEEGDHTWRTHEVDNDTYWGNAMYADLSFPYAHSRNTHITSPSYNLSSATGVIDFYSRCDTQYSTSSWSDYMALEFSANGGASFTEYIRWDEEQIDSWKGDGSPEGSATYHFTKAIPVEFLTNNFVFRLRWVSNATDNNYDGCMVDDIVILGIDDGADDMYEYSKGTSMAAPHVSGLTALLWGYKPSLTATEIKSAILDTGDATVSLAGKTVSGKRVNAHKALALIGAFDITPPIITLLGSTTVSISVGDAYTDAGATASDNSDGDITTNIVVSGNTVNTSVPGTYTITFNVSDASGNPAPEVTRVVHVSGSVLDTTQPVITLIGSNLMNILVGSTFTDPGATAEDTVDGNVSDGIVVTGAVNTNIIGSYTLTYTVTDTAGNSASKDRTVNVSDLELASEQPGTPSTNSVTISWTTSHPATSRVIWDSASHSDASTTEAGPVNYGYANSTVEDSNLVTNHFVTVSGLSPATTYYFRPVSHGSPEMVGAEVVATTKTQTTSGGGGGGGGGGSSSRDTSAPRSTSVSINNSTASTNQRAVTLSLSARDESTPMTMQVSNTNNFTGVSWVPYKTSHPWMLASGNGSKTVYVRFKDSKGNISSAVSDSITLQEAGGVVQTPQPSAPTPQPARAVQGASAFKFLKDLSSGMENQDVVELQKRLRSEGLFTHPTNTGYFGPATVTAVQAYQRKYGINATGYVGATMREKLNGATPSKDGELSLADFVRLLIAVGVIPPEKAALALSVLEGV